MNTEKTGKFIAALRTERRLTQAQLAEKLLVSDKAVSRWETGRGTPDLVNLEALAHELDVSVAELLRGEHIEAPVEPAEADELTTRALNLMRELIRKRTATNIVLGVLAGILVVTLVVVHLTSPIAIPYRNDAPIHVEELDGGTLLALADVPVAGIDVDTVELEGRQQLFVHAYTTRLVQILGTSATQQNARILGTASTLDAIYYYPGASSDVLLWETNRSDNTMLGGVLTLPRLIYNHWIVLGAVCSVIGLAAWLLLRKRWYAPRILAAALLPVCFTIATLAVIWGKSNQVYNAAFYFSGICIVALVLWTLALVLLFRYRSTPTTSIA